MNLFLDIESVPTTDPDIIAALSADIRPPGNMKKADTIAAWEANEKPAAILEAVAKTSFDGAYGKICSIAYAIDDGDIVSDCGTDEFQLIYGLYGSVRAAMKGGRDLTVIGHNVSGFDLKFLWKRSIVLGIAPAALPFHAKPWDSAAVFDTMVQWDADKDKRINLNNLCKVLGIPSPKGDLDGSQIAGAFAAGRFDDIAKYNAGDVEAVRRVYKRMIFAPVELQAAA